ncbi:MAG: electron transport complex subunit RsxG [Marinicella sp.]
MNDSTQNNWLLPLILAVMTLISSGLLMLSHELTAEKIAKQKLMTKLESLKRLIPAQMIDNDLISDAVSIHEPIKLGHRQSEQLYIGKKAGNITILAIPVTAQNGYSGDIDLLVGIEIIDSSNHAITAVEIISHKETPGLGDLIERKKSDWLKQFPGTSLQQPYETQWRVKKDQGHFDQITAATITPRAVVGAIKKALKYHQEYLTMIHLNNEIVP